MATSSLKATTVRKGGNIKPAVISDGSPQYNPLEDHNADDPKFLEDMVRTICQLDKESHEQIYIALRKTKPKKFFAANNVDTRFNINGLNDRDKQLLKRTIQLCVEDMERKKLFDQFTGTHRQEIAKLDVKLQTEFDAEDMDVADRGPSEAEKIREMLQMNNS
jgi:hypothetical protein